MILVFSRFHSMKYAFVHRNKIYSGKQLKKLVMIPFESNGFNYLKNEIEGKT